MAFECAGTNLGRELQKRADQLAIVRYAERLKVVGTRERAIKALKSAMKIVILPFRKKVSGVPAHLFR